MIEWLKLQFESWIEHRRNLQLRKFICDSCENLKMELAKRDELINKLLTKPSVEVVAQPPPNITRPHAVPWSVKRQELEKADRELAERLKKEKLTELEKEVIEAKVN